MIAREPGCRTVFIEDPKRTGVSEPKADATRAEPAATPALGLPGPVISWEKDEFPKRSLIRVTCDEADADKARLAREAVEKFESVEEGRWLRDALAALFFDPEKGAYRTQIDLVFADRISFVKNGDAAGSINPTSRGASHYWIQVLNREKRKETFVSFQEYAKLTPAQREKGEYLIRCHESWPAGIVTPQNKAWCLRICFADQPATLMAEVMFHELLHAFFINGGADPAPVKGAKPPPPRRYPTGHKDYAAGEFDRDFHECIEAMVEQLNAPFAQALRELEASPLVP